MGLKRKILASTIGIGIVFSSLTVVNANTSQGELVSSINYKKKTECIGNLDKNKEDISGHWAENSLREFIDKGYLNGYEDGAYKPNNYMTRAEFVTLVNRYFDLDRSRGIVFDDTENHWAKKEIDIAASNSICGGVSETKFEPNRYITREEAAEIIGSYMGVTTYDDDYIKQFKDKNKISDWALANVTGMVKEKYMNGYSDNTFRPKNKITRAECVTTLGRITDKEKSKRKAHYDGEEIRINLLKREEWTGNRFGDTFALKYSLFYSGIYDNIDNGNTSLFGIGYLSIGKDISKEARVEIVAALDEMFDGKGNERLVEIESNNKNYNKVIGDKVIDVEYSNHGDFIHIKSYYRFVKN